MLMADTMAIFFVILGMLLAFPGLWLLCRGLWPDTVDSASARCAKGLWSSFLVGVLITLAMVLLTVILFKIPASLGKVAGISLICLYMVHAHAGVAGLASAIGRRLASPVDQERPWRSTLRGGVVLELTYLLPFLGWFGILPLSIIVGSGAATLALPLQLRNALARRRFLSSHPETTAATHVVDGTEPAGAI
jgi:hypothetical protein